MGGEQLDRPSPLYRQLADRYAARIQAGHLSSGDKLPGSGELAAEWDVSRRVAELAMDELAKRGLVRREPHRGTYVI